MSRQTNNEQCKADIRQTEQISLSMVSQDFLPVNSSYKTDKYGCLLRIASKLSCGVIEETLKTTVKSVERDDTWITINFIDGGSVDMSPDEYKVVCEDYNMFKIRKGTKMIAYFGSLDYVAFIYN